MSRASTATDARKERRQRQRLQIMLGFWKGVEGGSKGAGDCVNERRWLILKHMRVGGQGEVTATEKRWRATMRARLVVYVS